MRLIKFLSLSIFIILIIAGCEDNTNTVFDHNASLQGYVTFQNGSPDTLSAVITISRNNMELAETYSDITGYYLVNNLASGDYFVSIQAEGYANSLFMINLINDQTTTADTVRLEGMVIMEFATREIDGVIDDGWMPVYTQDHESSWGGNDFEALYLSYDEEYLYIAVTGQFSSNDNTVSICLDKDGSGETGINDFRLVAGGDIGGRIKKNIDAPESFGADIAFNSGWGLTGEGVVSLLNPSQVDEAFLEDVQISMNTTTIEFAVSLQELYAGLSLSSISLVAYIGGGGDQYFANDVIPQGAGDFTGTFYEVFKIDY
jgi:hypothetical protein